VRLPRTLAEAPLGSALDALPRAHAAERRDRAILELLYSSGLRVSEAVSLDRAHLDVGGRLVRVRGKGNKERIVPVGKRALEAIHDMLNDRTANPRGVSAGARAAEPLFQNGRGGRLTSRSVQRMVAVRLFGVEAWASRRTPSATRSPPRLLDHGAELRAIQELLGRVARQHGLRPGIAVPPARPARRRPRAD
jgi:integrase/recombinase XerC